MKRNRYTKLQITVSLLVVAPTKPGARSTATNERENAVSLWNEAFGFSSSSPQGSPARVTVDSDIVRGSNLGAKVRRPH